VWHGAVKKSQEQAETRTRLGSYADSWSLLQRREIRADISEHRKRVESAFDERTGSDTNPDKQPRLAPLIVVRSCP